MQTERSNKLPLIILAVLVLAVIGFFVMKNMGSKSSPTPVASNVVQKQITMTEVTQHADQSSCWMVIGNNVYDVTSYVSQHPGGDMILSGCGKDATSMFNNRPGGGSHSSRALSVLSGFQIGTLSK
jgi:cytochrome b involved in lipid metabolism